MNNVVFIVPKGLSIGIFYSQILNLAIFLSKRKCVSIAIFYLEKEKYKNVEFSNCKVIYFLNYFDIAKSNSGSLLYVRDVYSFFNIFIYKFFYSLKLYYSYRGFVYLENFLNNKSYLKKTVIFVLEFCVYLLADFISVVSNVMRNELSSVFYFRRENVFVHPSCISQVVKKNTSIIGPDIIRFVYLGGISKWQNFDKVLRLFHFISNSLNNTEFTIISKEKDKIQDMLYNSYNDMKCNIISLDPIFVFDYLKGFDFGFLLRDESMLNRVSSPVKFLEYTSTGIIPIISGSIGDFSKDLQDLKLGINYTNDDELLKLIRSYFRDKSVYDRLFQYSSRFTWEKLSLNNSLDPLLN